jgi:hypothetical protein
MATYNAAITTAAGDDGNVDGVDELTAVKRAQDEALREFRALKAELIEEERQLHAAASNAMSNAASNSHGILSLLGGRSAASRARADQKRAITKKKNQIAQPLRQAKLAIDDAIRQINAAKGIVRSELAEERRSAPKNAVRRTTADLASELEKLAALRDSGVLDENEFRAAKAKLLG